MKESRFYVIWEYHDFDYKPLSQHKKYVDRFKNIKDAKKHYDTHIKKWESEIRNMIHSSHFPYEHQSISLVKAKDSISAQLTHSLYRTKKIKDEKHGTLYHFKRLNPYRVKNVKSDKSKERSK